MKKPALVFLGFSLIVLSSNCGGLKKDSTALRQPSALAAPHRAEPESEPLESTARSPDIPTTGDTHARPEAATAEPPSAVLRVHALLKERRLPVIDTELTLWPTTTDIGWMSGPEPKQSSRTDSDGWARFQVASGVAYRVWLPLWERGSFQRQVPPLVAGEELEIEILVPTEDDLVLFGKLVDAETGTPVSGGNLQVEDHRRSIMTSQTPDHRRTYSTPSVGSPVSATADGHFELHGKSWLDHFVKVKAPGYGVTAFALALGHSDSSRPLEVRMWRAAIIDAFVTDSSGAALEGAKVELSTDADNLAQDSPLLDSYLSQNPSWTATTGPGGAAVLEGLPPRVPIRIVVEAKGLTSPRIVKPIRLSPGERRAIHIAWGDGGTIRGQLLDAADRPVANRVVWCAHSQFPVEGGVHFGNGKRPTAVERTDANGRFQFDDIPFGYWHVGPAPSPDECAEEQASLPHAELVEIEDRTAPVEVVLRSRALTLQGQVLDPFGAPLPDCVVIAMKDSCPWVYGRTDASGCFSIGPASDGEWTVVARPDGNSHTSSLPVKAKAGETTLRLHVPIGRHIALGSIAGHVLTTDGSAILGCELSVMSTDAEWNANCRSAPIEGNFLCGGLLSGTYILSARDRIGRIGISPALRVEEGQCLENVEIRLRAGATLRLSYAGAAWRCEYTLHAAGVPIRWNLMDQRMRDEETVPPGEIELRWSDSAKHQRTELLSVSVGETREIVWDGKP